MPITTEDYVAISDHLGRYCWAVDDGDEDVWCDLWTEDGVFIGVTPEPAVGREGLRHIVRITKERGGGRIRHLVGSLTCDYGSSNDVVLARYYSLVTNWADGGKLRAFALCRVTLVRRGKGWLIKRNESEVFPG